MPIPITDSSQSFAELLLRATLNDVAANGFAPAGDLALLAIENGVVRGFSAYVGTKRSVDRGMRDGLRRISILEAELRGGSLCTDPADERAVIELCMGEEPQWQGVLRRVEVMRNLRRPALIR